MQGVAFLFLFYMLSLSLIFTLSITMYFGAVLFLLVMFGTLCACWTWVSVSYPMLRTFSSVKSSDIFSALFFLLSFCDSYNVNVTTLDFRGLLNFPYYLKKKKTKANKKQFYFFYLPGRISTTLSSSSLIHSSVPSNLLLIHSSIFLFHYCIFHVCFYIVFAKNF